MDKKSIRKVFDSVVKRTTSCTKKQCKEKYMGTSFMKIVFQSSLYFTESCFRRNFYLVHEKSVRLITVRFYKCPLYTDFYIRV